MTVYHTGVFDTTAGVNRDSTQTLRKDDGTLATASVFVSPVRYHAPWNVPNPSGARGTFNAYFVPDPNYPGTYTVSLSLAQDPTYPGSYSTAAGLLADSDHPGSFTARTR